MILAHKIALDPTADQAAYFLRASGTARKVWNWALDAWEKQYASGLKPNAMELKKQFNAVKYDLYPWLREVHRDAHARPFANLAKAWAKFFKDKKTGQKAFRPVFKSRHKTRPSFYVDNEKFKLNGKRVTLPLVGSVTMREPLRWEGKIQAATVSLCAGRWYISVQVDMLDERVCRPRTGNGTVGIDLGIHTTARLSTGESIQSPRPLKQALRRLRIRSRRQSRKLEAAKAATGIEGRIPKGTRLPMSNQRAKASQVLARTHARVADIRSDFTHKLTNRLCRENQTVVVEDLCVKGMMRGRQAKSIADVCFGEIRRQLTYKALKYGTKILVADRWFPSSKLCSICGWKNVLLRRKDREWNCRGCGTHHDRDLNAAINLRNLAA